MERRSLLKGALGTLSATVGTFALRSGVDARESASEGIQGQSAMTLVTGPDPDTYVYVEWVIDSRVLVIPPHTQLWSSNSGVSVRGMGIPRAEFPEFDAKHGAVTIFEPDGRFILPGEWTVPMIRAHYQYAVGQRQPDLPLDGNHLSMRFMPWALHMKMAGVTLDGELASHIVESYDGPNGWVVQLVTDDSGKVVTFGDNLRYRIVTGNVKHWMDGVAVSPGDYTAPLLPPAILGMFATPQSDGTFRIAISDAAAGNSATKAAIERRVWRHDGESWIADDGARIGPVAPLLP